MKNISTISPALLFAGSNLNFITDSYNSDITETLKKIHEILSKQSDKPVLIYIHCNGGRDRSGFVIAAYRLLFKDMNLQKVNSLNVKEVARNSEGFYEDAIGSYCKYLKREQKKSDDFCIQQKD
jgi:protein-tyrosine phosphatase